MGKGQTGGGIPMGTGTQRPPGAVQVSTASWEELGGSEARLRFPLGGGGFPPAFFPFPPPLPEAVPAKLWLLARPSPAAQRLPCAQLQMFHIPQKLRHELPVPLEHRLRGSCLQQHEMLIVKELLIPALIVLLPQEVSGIPCPVSLPPRGVFGDTMELPCR